VNRTLRAAHSFDTPQSLQHQGIDLVNLTLAMAMAGLSMIAAVDDDARHRPWYWKDGPYEEGQVRRSIQPCPDMWRW
jgi:hypothetical protein